MNGDRGKPREQYERCYVLLPPGADDDWAEGAVIGGWGSRYTVGGSADDAGIGDLDVRRVIAVNPLKWDGGAPALLEFFRRHYPGIEYAVIEADTPAELAYKLEHFDYQFITVEPIDPPDPDPDPPVSILNNGDFLADWGDEKSHRALVFPLGDDGEPLPAYERDVPEIFTPPDWLFWFAHDGDEWAQPEAGDAHKSVDPRRVLVGDKAYKWFTTGKNHIAGLMQTVDVADGSVVKFSIFAHAWSNHSDPKKPDDFPHPNNGRWSEGAGFDIVSWLDGTQPETGDAQQDAKSNFMFRVGIDPFGGSDPFDDRVIWSRGYHNYNGYVDGDGEAVGYMVVEAEAEADRVTVFVRSVTRWPFKHNDAYVDKARLVVISAPDPEPDPDPPPAGAVRFGLHDGRGIEWQVKNNVNTVGLMLATIDDGDPPVALDVSPWKDAGFDIYLRVGYSYGKEKGTIPDADHVEAWIPKVAQYINGLKGFAGVLIGNEIQNIDEWPGGWPNPWFFITPEYFVDTYNKIIARVTSDVPIAPGPVDPFNVLAGQFAGLPADPAVWARYIYENADRVDFIPLHVKSQTNDPREADPTTEVGQQMFGDWPLIGRFMHLATILDQLRWVPLDWWEGDGKKVVVSELNPQRRADGSLGWDERGPPWLRRAATSLVEIVQKDRRLKQGMDVIVYRYITAGDQAGFALEDRTDILDVVRELGHA